MGTFLLGTVVCGIFLFAGYVTYKNHKKGGGCGCGCEGCALADQCHGGK